MTISQPNTTITNGMISGMMRSSPNAKLGDNSTLTLPGALAQSVCANAAPTEPMWDAGLNP